MSFSERAGITAPLVPRGDRGRVSPEALVHAAQERAVAVEYESEAPVGMVAVARAGRARGLGDAGDLVAGQAELAVACRRERVELAERAAPADEHVRAREVRATREVEADERNLRARCDRRRSRARLRPPPGPPRAAREPHADSRIG